MKVEYFRNDSIEFRLIVPGDCFLFKNVAYMRVETMHQTNRLGDEIKYNAVNLVQGSWIGISDLEKVVPIDGKFTITT